MTDALNLQVRLYQAGVLLLALAVGTLAGIEPRYAVALSLGIAFACLVMTDLTIGLMLFTTVAFLEALPFLFGGLSFAKAIGALLALSWFATVATRRHPGREIVNEHPLLSGALLLLVSWCGLSILWAQDTADVIDGTQRWVLNMMLFPIVFAAVRRPEHLRWLFAVFVVGALFSALSGMLGFLPAGDDLDEGRLSGAGINPNQLGGLLVVSTVLAGALALRRGATPPARLLWLAASAVSVLALMATLSRGAILGMIFALLAAPFLAGRRGRAAAVAGGLVLALFVGIWMTTLAPEASVQRLVSSDRTGSGRTDIWRVGWRMVEDNPIVGVGTSNYQEAAIRYLIQPGALVADQHIVDKPKVAHNVYLHVLAELGIVGLGLFGGVLAFCVYCGMRAASLFAARGDPSSELLSRALAIALLGLLAACFFSSALYSKQLWLMLACGPAVLAIARSAPSANGG